jgi:hypothetical protein
MFGRVRAVPRLCELYSGICLTIEEKARKNLSPLGYLMKKSYAFAFTPIRDACPALFILRDLMTRLILFGGGEACQAFHNVLIIHDEKLSVGQHQAGGPYLVGCWIS